jgi:hypothetical protein
VPAGSRSKIQQQVVRRTKYNHWIPLHRYAVENAKNWDASEAEKWYNEWSRKIPAINCECRRHWKELVAEYPPTFTNYQAFFEWGVARHNDVSMLHANKPTITLDDAYSLYWKGEP